MAPKTDYKIDWATQKGISYSQYSLYSHCQYQWYLQYAKKIKIFKPSIHLCFGTSFHETLQEYIRVMYEVSAKEADQMDFEAFLKERMFENYKEIYENNGNIHFAKEKDFKDIIEDGLVIMDFIRKKRSQFFSLRNTKLKGIEIPIKGQVFEDYPSIFMIGSVDLIFYEKNTDSYTIYDIKTSTRGWSDNDKRDAIKLNQILLYKHYYSKLMNIPLEKVDVKFFIVKRKPYENPDFPTHRIQEFVPANGKKKVENAVNEFKSFIESCYDKSGHLIERKYEKNLSGCMYCPFNDKPEHCNRNEE